VRRVLKRSSFTSLDDLRERVLAFIADFNEVPSKPFRLTYTGATGMRKGINAPAEHI
jgi:hypothetical protein